MEIVEHYPEAFYKRSHFLSEDKKRWEITSEPSMVYSYEPLREPEVPLTLVFHSIDALKRKKDYVFDYTFMRDGLRWVESIIK
jgi:hypothetical protein